MKIFYMYTLLYVYLYCRQWVDEMTAEVNSRNVLVEVPASRRMMISEESSVTPAIATATMALFTTNLDDVFISVKTTKHYHHSRLPAIISTWFQFAKDQVRDKSSGSFHASCILSVECANIPCYHVY